MARTLVCGVGVGLFLKTGTLSSLAFFKFHTNKTSKSTFCPSMSWGVEKAPLPGSSDL